MWHQIDHLEYADIPPPIKVSYFQQQKKMVLM